MTAHVLALDIAGNPFEWLAPSDAVYYYATGKVAWDLGDKDAFVFRGGHSRAGVQSVIRVKPVMVIANSEMMARKVRHSIPLGHDNDLLFRRDHYMCAYCGGTFPRDMLSRDHVIPKKLDGLDTWTNCVTACKPCNQAKGHKLVEQFKDTIYVPYAPCRFEHFILSGRNVLADQMEYLAANLPEHSRMLRS